MKVFGLSLVFFAGMIALGLIGCGTLDSGKKAESRDGLKKLQITEIHYHPLGSDTISGDLFEFVEIYNSGDIPLPLNGVGFTQGIEINFGVDDVIPAHGYWVLAADSARFLSRYGVKPFKVYKGQLSNSGETLTLSDLPAGTVIESISYSDQLPWPIAADGEGYSMALSPTGSWKSSFAIHGSPGKGDPLPIYINEIATHEDFPDTDAIELLNPNETEVSIAGWFLSDDEKNLLKYRIPEGTVIPAGGYWLVDAKAFNSHPNEPHSFMLNEHGDQVFLSSDSTGCAGYCHGFTFGAVENGVTLGRHVTSRGAEHFVAMAQPTLGKKNSAPKSSPLVLSEVMYHPVNDSDEYVELVNLSKDSLALFDPTAQEMTWKLKGMGFDFPKGITLFPGEVVVILSASAAPVDSFRTVYGVPDSVRLFRANGRLSNSGDTLSLLMPLEPYQDVTGTLVPYRELERLQFSDGSAWPSGADGKGLALVRKELNAYGDDPDNWKAASPTPGR